MILDQGQLFNKFLPMKTIKSSKIGQTGPLRNRSQVKILQPKEEGEGADSREIFLGSQTSTHSLDCVPEFVGKIQVGQLNKPQTLSVRGGSFSRPQSSQRSSS